MAEIAEDLFLLLLDNASAQPALDRTRRERVLSAAVLLDLAHACRIRPAMVGEPVEAGRLLTLAGDDPLDPVLEPALQVLQRRPLRPAKAMERLRKNTQANLTRQLELTGQIQRVRLPSKRFRSAYAWPVANRQRVSDARAALLAALFDGQQPNPSIASIIALLHAIDGLGALLSLNDRGWRWVHARAAEIASGGWIDEYDAEPPEVNLAVTVSAVRRALM